VELMSKMTACMLAVLLYSIFMKLLVTAKTLTRTPFYAYVHVEKERMLITVVCDDVFQCPEVTE